MQPAMTDQLLAEIESEFHRYERREHPVNFPPLPEFSVSRYADPKFWALEQKHLWPRVWMIAGHIGELPENGSYKLWDESGVPIIIVRGKDKKIRAFYNVCQHRGGPLAYQREGKVSVLTCKYHGWTYDLEGALKFVHDEHELPGLDKSTRHLKQLRCELWGNFIFVNRDSDALPLLDFLGPLAAEFEDYRMDKRHVYAKIEYKMRCNWKTGIESNAEAYHVIAVHPETVHKTLDYRGNVIHLFKNGHSRIITPYNQSLETLKFGIKGDDGADATLGRSAIRNYVIFPNIMISAGADESPFPLITYWPDGIGNTKMVVYYTTTNENEDPDSPAAQEVVQGFDVALEEDRASLAATQEAYEKGLVEKVRLAYVERRLYHLEEHVDRMIGIDNIPQADRLKSITAPHVVEPYAASVPISGCGTRS